MKKISLILSAAVVAVLFSCSKEIAPNENVIGGVREGITIIEVSSPETKTCLGDPDSVGVRKVYWQNGDRIVVNGVVSDSLSGVSGQSTSASFTFQALLDHPYSLVSPASVYKDQTTITLPSKQVLTEKSFDPAASVALAYAATVSDPLKLKNACSIIKISLKKGTFGENMTSIEFSGNNNEQISGDFTVNYQTGTISSASASASDKKVTMDISGVTLSDSAVVAHIVVPAGTYANGFAFRIADGYGHYMDNAKASAITLEAGKVYALPEIQFNPTGTLVIVSNAKEYVDFVTAFNSGKYGTKETNVVVEVTDTLDFEGMTFKTLGNGSYEFSGKWHGNKWPMKNISATNESLFYLPANAEINGIVVDASCSFTKTAAMAGHWGIIARTIDSGSISDCDINCDWKIDYKSNSGSTFTYGSLCGRIGGKMTNCNMNGKLIYTRTVTTKEVNPLWIGGLVGYVNAGAEMSGCSTTGDVIFNEPTSDKRPTCTTVDKYFCVGGVAGANKGTIKNCKMTGNFEYRDCPKDAFIGGVIGNSEDGSIEGCSMEGNIKAFQTGANTSDYARLFVGGVLGRAASTASVSNLSTKEGTTMEFGSLTLNIAAGGIVASMPAGTPVVSGCVNNMKMIQKDYAPLRAQYGGIVGAFSKGTLTNVENKADISVGKINNASTSYLGCGGVIGYMASSISGTITSGKSSIHNSGKIYTNAADTTCTGFGSASFGGVVGIQNGGNITGVTNSGLVHLYFLGHKSTTKPINKVYAGGIVGNICAACALSESSNSAQVKVEAYSAKSNNRMIALGGIVGIVTPLNNLSNGVTGVSIKNCTMTSTVYSTNNNLAAPAWNFASGKFEGGIVGGAKGTAASPTVIENCTCAASSGFNYSAYGYQGGIAGGVIYSQIKNCKVKSILQGFNSQANTRSIVLSGIAVYARNSSIKECTVDNVQVKYCRQFSGICHDSAQNDVLIEGNTVNVTVTASEISADCYMVVKNAANSGGTAKSTVQNNGVKGTINGTKITTGNVKYCGTDYTCGEDKPNYVIAD